MTDNKFGMFIHWGFYALTEVQEQAFARMDMPREEYESLMHSFDPVKYDPEEWVLLAKSCGMKYICFTAKHHDGFCMWDTKYSDYSIMNTPYRKDVLRMLADACEKHGMLLSLYYSNPDWNHPYGYNPLSTHQWKAKKDKTDTEIYREYIRNQITELLTNYGKIYTLFWDIPPKIEDKSLNELARKLQPGIFINDRGFDTGDFSTPEREYKEAGGERFTRMTEACNAIDVQSWGYRRDTDFYSYRHILGAIDKIMASGGSYLLNIGPMADGSLDPTHVERFRRIGDWYNRMDGCLEGHTADDREYEVYKSGKCICTKKNGKSYLHFYEGTMATAITIRNHTSLPKRVRLVNTGEELPFANSRLPAYFNGKTGIAETEFLHVRKIPTDDLSNEPVVIEIEW